MKKSSLREKHTLLMIFWNWSILTFVNPLVFKVTVDINFSFYLWITTLEWWLQCFLKLNMMLF